MGIDAESYSYDELYSLVAEFQQLYTYNTQGQEVKVIDEDNVNAPTVITQQMNAGGTQ